MQFLPYSQRKECSQHDLLRGHEPYQLLLICANYLTMKPDFEIVPYQPSRSYVLRTIERESRNTLKGAWHFHPEIEICLTLKSKGKRFVGIDIEDYQEGDLVLLGPDLPHCWITQEETEQIVVQFKADFLGKDFFNVSELRDINRLLKKSATGLKFESTYAAQATPKLLQMRESNVAAGLVLLLDVLQILSEDDTAKELTSTFSTKKAYADTSQKIAHVYSYILENMRSDVTLEEAARRIGMCKSNLCNFLKYNTKKTFSEIVNDIRVSYAARQLQETDMTVQEVCYDAGFRDPSYFYRVFQQRLGMPPRKYKISYAIAG